MFLLKYISDEAYLILFETVIKRNVEHLSDTFCLDMNVITGNGW